MSSKNLHIDNMEKLAIVLALPHKNTYNALPEVDRPAGLPINALPGWESIPLHSKLPMLKCPNNQVIFTKNKIGRSHEKSQRDFDSVCLNAKMDYNPLHDPHLGRFYSNEKLLKRLRENGEITENNDVICTLKEFNEHRIPLHETYLSLIRSQRNKIDEEQQDVHMIAHAEKIAERDKTLAEKSSKGTNCFGDILRRKAELYKQRAQRNQVMLDRNRQKEEQIETQKTLEEELLRHKKDLHNYRIKHILDVGVDIQRKRLIALKKHLQYKSDRLNRNIKLTKEKQSQLAKEKAEISWEMHLKERIMKHEKLKQITRENQNDMKEWIANHMAQYQHKWSELQQQLENRCGRWRHLKIVPKRKKLKKKIKRALEKSDNHNDQLKNLTSDDIHDALQTAVDLENPHKLQHYNSDDYIFKAAKYILEDILAKFDKDLSGERDIESVIATRINRLFTDVKQYVLKRATHIISADISNAEQKRVSFVSSRNKRYSLAKGVSFNSLSTLIGTGSYALNEADDIKFTAERHPTPAGSLTSVIIDADEDDDCEGHKMKQRKSLHHLSRDERIFIEHLFIKFKRQLLVGVGKQVLAAIECHKKNKILDVRKELQDIDKQFLVKLMTRSILSYAVNNCNFYSNTLLCQYSLAGDIILLLQKSLLKPQRDPRVIVQPRSRCVCILAPPFTTYCQ